jgi:phosphoribosylamine--glycine ligase/phosphoribosylglycinamide formyltransferase/phosphoribosylformylglycinamidine cyclo-ligase
MQVIDLQVVSHKDFNSRELFDSRLNDLLQWWKIDLVVLAGFMRILSQGFVRQWRGKLVNIHPSLLPAFKGTNAQKQALDAGVRITGCTVHFVEPEVDSGAIIAQESVSIKPEVDALDDVVERIKSVEHKLYPQALELVASSSVSLCFKTNRVVYQ